MTRRGRLFLALALVAVVVLGAVAYKSVPRLTSWARPEPSSRWPDDFSVVELESSADGSRQKAMFHAARGPNRPLIVSLHPWAGDYDSADSLASPVGKEDWNYIHPDFRGPNRSADNCLSEKVVADIDDAIAYGLRAGRADPEQIFVVGFSGGGYAALGMYTRTRFGVRAFLAWSPISDLGAWHDELTRRGDDEVARQIRQCTGSDQELNREAARLRSPLYWTLRDMPKSRIEIFSGIDDGHTGPVPVSQSILFFNRLAEWYGARDRLIRADEISALSSRRTPRAADMPKIAGRQVLFQRSAGFGSLTLFDGGHEILPSACIPLLRSLSTGRPFQGRG